MKKVFASYEREWPLAYLSLSLLIYLCICHIFSLSLFTLKCLNMLSKHLNRNNSIVYLLNFIIIIIPIYLKDHQYRFQIGKLN